MANERKVITLAKGRFKKNDKFYGISQFGQTPPLFWKFIKNDAVFWPSASQIMGVTFHESLFWCGEGVGGHKYEIVVIQFLIILRGTLFTLTKIIIVMEWPNPPSSIWKIP